MANTWDPNKKLVQDVPPPIAPTNPLPRSAFIDPTSGAERPINNPVTNPQNYTADVATGQSNAAINAKIDAVAHDTTLSPAEKQKQMDALNTQKNAPIGLSSDMRTQVNAQQNLPQNQYTPPAVPTVNRDIKAEASTAQKYGIDPNNPQDVVAGHNITYTPPQLTALINSGQVDASHFSADKLQQLGITPDRIQQLMAQTTDPAAKQRLQTLYSQLQQTGTMGAQVESTMNATPKPTNQMMNVLSEALNAKNNYKNQALGTSDLFKQAGLSGYSVLAQSLNNRMAEMQDKSKSAQNLISETGGAMASTYSKIADNYNKIMQEYDSQTKMLLDIDQRAKDHEDAMALLDKQQQNEKDTATWKAALDAKNLTKVTLDGHDYMVDGNGVVHTIKDQDGNTVLGSGAVNGDSSNFAPVKSAPKGTVFLGDKLLDQGTYNSLFNVGGIGGQCGTWASTVSTAGKVGNTWAKKKTKIETQDNPGVGYKLLVPFGVDSKGNGTGHVAVVTAYDPTTGDIQVVQSNIGLDGKITTGTYNINDLNKKYGTNWGFESGQLKSKGAQALTVPGQAADAALAAFKEKGGWLGKAFQPTIKALGIAAGTTGAGQAINAGSKSLLDQGALPEHQKTYEEQVSPYLIQNPQSQEDRQVNMIINQKATLNDLFGTGRSEKVIAARQALIDKVSQQLGGDFNPTNLDANVQIRKTYDTMMTKFRSGFDMNESNLTGELQNLKQLSAQYPRSALALQNDLQNIKSIETSNPQYAKFLNAINTTADSYGKIMSGTGMGNAATAVSFKNQALSMLSNRMGDGGLNAQIDQINFEMKNKAQSIINQDMTNQLYPISSKLPTGAQLSQTKGQENSDPLASYRAQLQPGEILLTDGNGNYVAGTQQDLASNPSLKQA